MSKLYIFGIGGTGSRVIKSLTMLLAAGVDCGADTIVPIIIDKDTSNKDLTRTHELIKEYMAVHEVAKRIKTGNGVNRFFQTEIKLLKDDQLVLSLKGDDKKFHQYIGKSTMTQENRALVEMLFSEKTLNFDMTVGFQGNPNIGSVVLNQFDDEDVFKAFAEDFVEDGNKIFIVSSIFGGTGASGFPLLLKGLHQIKDDMENGGLANWTKINKAPIGAVSVLPYFTVGSANDGSLVDSNTFIDKAKAALDYYRTLNKQLDTFYYIGDNMPSSFEHHKGGDEQKNNAHFVELASALAILDFVSPNNKDYQTNGKLRDIIRDTANSDIYLGKTTYSEYGIMPNPGNEECHTMNLLNLCKESKSLMTNPLARFLLFSRYMGYIVSEEDKNGKKIKKVEKLKNNIFDEQFDHQPYGKAFKKESNSFRKGTVITNIENLQARFVEWLLEMETQNRVFSPFDLETTDAFGFIKGDLKIEQNISGTDRFGIKGWALIDNELNKQHNKIKKMAGDERFLELFYRTTENLIIHS